MPRDDAPGLKSASVIDHFGDLLPTLEENRFVNHGDKWAAAIARRHGELIMRA
jgi:hypothetical protein